MSEKNHFAALQEIRRWNTDDVICALKNNGLAECVDACKKRDISGEKLLELSEMKLGLWKRDLTIGNIRKLAGFIQDISKMPAKYTICNMSSNSDDAWDTDFDDDEVEEDGSQKTEINIPNGSNLERKESPSNASYQTNGTVGAQNLGNKNSNTQQENQLSPINRHITNQMRNKINIPSAFATGSSSQNGSTTNLSAGNVTKPPFLKANGTTDTVKKEETRESNNAKPIIPCRPQSLYTKSSSQENTPAALPKPPAFDNDGLVLKEIWDKLPLEPDLMDEYESIDDLSHARSIRSEICRSNGKGSSSSFVHQNVAENLRKSPVSLSPANDVIQQVSPKSSLHRNQLYISQKINSLSQQNSKADQESVIENIKKSPVLTSGYTKKHEGTIQTSRSVCSVNQEKVESLRRSPVPLPPRNEVKQESLPASALHLTHQINSYRLNEGHFTSGSASKISKDYDDSKPRDEKHEDEINENMHCEKVYETIPEHMSTNCKRAESCEYSEGYLLPKAPSLPPKPKQTPNNIKSPAKINKTESNGTSGSLWSFGSQKHKSQQGVHQEKSTQDGKKNNTLPMPRPMNSYVSEAPRPSASRPLPPPPPPDGGVLRVIKIPLVQMPWYFNVDRARGEEILRNCEDGTFMIRPSTKTQNALTLTLKYGKRPFNICVRHRPDGKFALGTAKPTEQTFSSVEELVNHYMSNELLLYSNGKQAGIVVLSSPPRKD